MKQKTFKIGECAKGGVITAQVTSKEIIIIAKDWDFSAGSNKGSNQKNAKEFDRETIAKDDRQSFRKATLFLEDLTTSYYAGTVIYWIEENGGKLNKEFDFWI